MVNERFNLEMKKRDRILKKIIYLALCFVLFSCNKKVSNSENSNVEERITENDLTVRAEEAADSIQAGMTLEEMVGQCLMPSIYANSDPASISLLRKYIEDYHVGGIVLLKGNLNGARKLAEIGASARIPLFIAIDAEWGLGMRLEDAPVYPKNGNLGNESDDTELFDYGFHIAEEAKEVGINMVLGPVIDIATMYPGVIGERSFGDNPKIVSEYGVAYAKGLESGGVISVAKHFPGHGSTKTDSHRGVAKVERDIAALDSIDLLPFREYVNVGLTGIMAGHIQSLALDPEGRAATVSIDMLTSLLREEMGFQGLVLTDAFDMGGAKGFSAVEALKAGADLILCPENLEKEYFNIMEAVEDGDLDISVVKDRCSRILFYKYLFKILQVKDF